MTIQFSDTLRNNQAAELEPLIADGTLEIRSGSPPANTAAADTGTLLCEIDLPSDPLTAPSSGTVTKNGTWSGVGTSSAGSGTNAGHFRIKGTGGAVVMQGTVTVTGGGGDMTLDNVNIAQNQAVSVGTFSYTRNNG